jgi:hypothetical protein
MVGWEDAVPKIKRVMNAAIMGMLLLDLALTVLIFSRGFHPPRAPSPQQAVVASPLQPGTGAVSTAMASASFLLLRAPDISGGQPYVSPSANASNWDYGGGTNTAQNWANWALTSSLGDPLIKESYSYENPYRAATSSWNP